MSKFLRAYALLAALCGLLALAPASSSAPQSNPNPKITPINSISYGYSYGQWQERFWKWYVSQPFATNPVFDPTGDLFANGQTGPVWFLPGGFGEVERHVKLPAGKALYVPFVNAVFWSHAHDFADPPNEFGDLPDAKLIAAKLGLDPDDLSDEELLSLLANYVMTYAEGSIEIDGKEVKNLSSYLASTPAFKFVDQDLFTDFGFEVDGIAVSAGYAVILSPLTPGEHTIRVKAKLTVPDPTLTYLNFEAEVVHHITVAAK